MKLVKIIQEYASIVITAVIIIILATMMFVVMRGIDNWRNPAVWLDAGFNSLLQLIMIATWLPEGKKRGEQNEVYKQNKENANRKMQSATQPENFDALTCFCEYATKMNIEAWIAKRVVRFNVMYAQWGNEAYRRQFDEKIQQKVMRVERRALIRVDKIKATEIATKSAISLQYDTKDHTDTMTMLKFAGKIIISVSMCTIGACIGIDRVEFSVAALVHFLYWVLIMMISIFFSIHSGYKLITVERNDYYKRMIVFLSHFEAWQEGKMFIGENVKVEKAPE